MTSTIYIDGKSILNNLADSVLAVTEKDFDSALNDLWNNWRELLGKNNGWVKIENKKVYYNLNYHLIVPDINRLDVPTAEANGNNSISNWNGDFEGFSGDSFKSLDTVRQLFFHPTSPFYKKTENYCVSYCDGTSWLKCNGSTWWYIDRGPNSLNIPYFGVPAGNSLALLVKYDLIPSDLSEPDKKTLECIIKDHKNGVIDDSLKPILKALKSGKVHEFFGVEFTAEGLKKRLKEINLSENDFKEFIASIFLETDKRRANIEPYDLRRITDVNEGHWEIKTAPDNDDELIAVNVDMPVTSRDPRVDVQYNGTVGIDFGTRSTIVAFYNNSAEVRMMRIGVGDVSLAAKESDYENPTIMEFINIDKFLKDYSERDGRPETLWSDIKVSHEAYSDFTGTKDENDARIFYSYFYDLKQWCGDTAGKRSIKIIDRKDHSYDLKIFADSGEDDFDPIEIYAYYLGLYINNMRNGIFIDYVMSFPVTYEKRVREKIIASFERGLKKSLPSEVLNDESVMSDFKVRSGAGEPAAYAVCALGRDGYNIIPKNDQRLFYGIFDMGGGTTDFDFGFIRNTNENKRREKRYDYVIERFGAGGDQYLGGENLLELLAYELFKANVDSLRKSNGTMPENKGFTFTCPESCKPFDGSEALIDTTEIAKRNTKQLVEQLRPFVENLKLVKQSSSETSVTEEQKQDFIKMFKSANVLSDSDMELLDKLIAPIEITGDFLTLNANRIDEDFYDEFAACFNGNFSNEKELLIFEETLSVSEYIYPFTNGELERFKEASSRISGKLTEQEVFLYLYIVKKEPANSDDNVFQFEVGTVIPNQEKITTFSFDQGKIDVDLFNREGEYCQKVPIFFDNGKNIKLDMLAVLSERILQGVKNFFKSLLLAISSNSFKARNIQLENIYVFFAGNACKSPLVINIFNKYVNEYFSSECAKLGIDISKNFKIFPPLGTEDAHAIQRENGIEISTAITAPTGKTGVVRGLLDDRILVINDVAENEDVPFKFFLGENVRGRFRALINANIPLNKWELFTDATENTFKIYYTALAECIDGHMDINSAKLKKCTISKTSEDEDVNIYIRATRQNSIEYCVAKDSELASEKYICEPVSVLLD